MEHIQYKAVFAVLYYIFVLFYYTNCAEEIEASIRLKDSYENAQSPSTVGSTTLETTTSVFFPFYISSHLPRVNPVCGDLTELAYRSNWCGASSPSHYLELNRARLSCSERCAVSPFYNASQIRCMCDERCVVRGDCCFDIVQVCPHVLQAGVSKFYHVFDLYEDCTKFLTDSTCLLDFEESKSEKRNNPVQNPPFEPRQLGQYSKVFSMLQVVDSFLGVAFSSWDTFTKCQVPESRPSFVPVVTRLDCRDVPVSSRSKPNSILEVLRWCRVEDIQDDQVRFPWSCPPENILSCRCEATHQELLTNVCLGRDELVAHYQRRYPSRRWPTILSQWIKLPQPEKVHQCNIQNLSALANGARDLWSALEFDNAQVMHMKIVPVLQETTPVLNSQLRKPREQNRARGDEQSHVDSTNLTTDIHFDVLLTKTVETRMRCASLDNFLSECQLIECRPSALLSSNANFQSRFGDLSCQIPDHALIVQGNPEWPVETCVCFKALLVLSKLRRWSVIRERDLTGLCMFKLTDSVEEKTEAFSRIQMQWKHGLMYGDLNEHRSSSSPSKRTATIEQQLHQFWLEVKGVCPDDENRPVVEVQFFTSIEANISTSNRQDGRELISSFHFAKAKSRSNTANLFSCGLRNQENHTILLMVGSHTSMFILFLTFRQLL